MSHLPWMMQQHFGLPPPPRRVQRVATLTDETPATFSGLNWNHAENCTTNPRPAAGIVTLMGPMGLTRDLPYRGAVMLVIRLVRSMGLIVDTGLPEASEMDAEKKAWLKPDSTTPEEMERMWIEDHDLDYFEAAAPPAPLQNPPKKGTPQEEDQAACETKDGDSPSNNTHEKDAKDWRYRFSTMGDGTGMWLYVRCATADAADAFLRVAAASTTLGNAVLCRVAHAAHVTEFASDEVVVRAVTGDGGNTVTDVGTFFSLRWRGKLIAKCLCSYLNMEMDQPGPTIELFEVAGEFQGHGYGSMLLEAVTSFHCDLFEAAIDAFKASDDNIYVVLSVCHVTNQHAAQWFQNHDFNDLDGIGEELGKDLDDGIALNYKEMAHMDGLYVWRLAVSDDDIEDAGVTQPPENEQIYVDKGLHRPWAVQPPEKKQRMALPRDCEDGEQQQARGKVAADAGKPDATKQT